ncbi:MULTISPECIES: cellulose synthase operon protein YhjQ/BcsQ [Aeromonas]|uniref:cellulose synthase operon protein YhjQ/BcsQ n=1 Tax=Aeromonas TaxID=642 RepID=UPI0022E45CB1|nr:MULTISPECIES: cellulose synthase operon protein YhjQ/BcsQ [Aeromonas]WED81977.1 cellulose synthase operon protein YhjQ/BcsQ [Aeromonas media]
MNLVALQGIRGGVGTTSLVAGLALAAREQGARVLAVRPQRLEPAGGPDAGVAFGTLSL